jgi:hypothetical protein
MRLAPPRRETRPEIQRTDVDLAGEEPPRQSVVPVSTVGDAVRGPLSVGRLLTRHRALGLRRLRDDPTDEHRSLLTLGVIAILGRPEQLRRPRLVGRFLGAHRRRREEHDPDDEGAAEH